MNIWPWSRIRELKQANLNLNRRLVQWEEELGSDLTRIKTTLSVIGPGLGRVIAKLDAKYAESEFSTERRAESDKLAEETFKRLEAEAAARAPYNTGRD